MVISHCDCGSVRGREKVLSHVGQTGGSNVAKTARINLDDVFEQSLLDQSLLNRLTGKDVLV